MQFVAYSFCSSLISVSHSNLRVTMKVTMPYFLLLSRVVFMNDIFLYESDLTKKHTYCWKHQLSSSNWCGSDFHLLATETLEKHHTNYIRSHRYNRCRAGWCNWWMFGLCEMICLCIWTCLMMETNGEHLKKTWNVLVTVVSIQENVPLFGRLYRRLNYIDIKYLHPKVNGYGYIFRQRSCGSTYCTWSMLCVIHTLCKSILEPIPEPSHAAAHWTTWNHKDDFYEHNASF